MKSNGDKSLRFVLVLSLISLGPVHPRDIDVDGLEEPDYGKGCSDLNCAYDEVCVQRRFSCGNPPCPRMLFCARTKKEYARGPGSCDFASCTRGHVCVVKVRRCHWDEKCEQQIARCVSQKEMHEGPATCAGSTCSKGEHCILRETDCVNPPCKVSSTCQRDTDVQAWFAKCRSLGCPSEYECFLRRPETYCPDKHCEYIPDCTTTIEEELRNEFCQGWICPRFQTCQAKFAGECETGDCDIKRSCQEMQIQAEQSLATYDNTAGKVIFQWSGKMDSAHSTSEDFRDWLETVKATLGADVYNRWLDYIRHSANSDWIPIPRSILSVAPRRSINVGSNVKRPQKVDGATITNSEAKSANDAQCQSTDSKHDYQDNFGSERDNSTIDQSLEKLNVSEFLGMIDEIITILNSSSTDRPVNGITIKFDPVTLNVQESESRDKMMHPALPPNVVTRVHENPEVPGERSVVKIGPNYSASESFESPAGTNERK